MAESRLRTVKGGDQQKTRGIVPGSHAASVRALEAILNALSGLKCKSNFQSFKLGADS